MDTITVVYHHEGEGWWADSPDLPGYVAAADTLHQVRELVHEGVPFYLDCEQVVILETGDVGQLVVDVRASTLPWYSLPVPSLPEPGSESAASKVKVAVTAGAWPAWA